MCGRYLLDLPGTEIATALGAADRTNGFTPTWNAAPSQQLPVLGFNPNTRERSLVMMEWGLMPSWAQSGAIRPQINARAETVAERPMFRSAFAHRRCLIPMRGWYEWSVQDGRKAPWVLKPACDDHDIPTAAGLWEARTDAAGSAHHSFAIITCDAAPDIKHLHSRQPVLIDTSQRDIWLSPDSPAAHILASLLRASTTSVAHWQVSNAVNSVRNDDPSLVVPAAAS